jgi:hypothetical protein
MPDDDLRDRIAEAAAQWALAGPIRYWALGSERGRQDLAMAWASKITDAVLPVVEPELERLRAELSEAGKAVTNAVGSERYMEKHLRQQDDRVNGLRQEVARQRERADRAEAQRDAKLNRKAIGRSLVEMRDFAQRETRRAEQAEAEVKRLQGEWDRLNEMRHDERDRAFVAEAERDALKEAIERVRNLHSSMTHGGIAICGHCSGWNGFRCGGRVQPFPCPTLADLDTPTDRDESGDA